MNTVKRRFVVSLITIIALVFTMIPTIGIQRAEAASAGSSVVQHITATTQFPIKKIEYAYNGDNTFNMKLTLDFTVYQGTTMDLEQLNDSEIYISSSDRSIAAMNVNLDTSDDEMTIDLVKQGAKTVKAGESYYIKIYLFHSAQDAAYAGYDDFENEYFTAPTVADVTISNHVQRVVDITAPTVADVTDPDVTKDIFQSVERYTLKEALSDTKEEYEDIYVEFKAQVKSGTGNYLYAFNKNDNGLYGVSSATNSDTVSALIYRNLSSNPIDFTGKKSNWVLIAAPDKDTAKAKIGSIVSNGNGKNLSLPAAATIKGRVPTEYRVTQTSSRYDQMKVTVDVSDNPFNTVDTIEVYNYNKGVGEGSLYKTLTPSESGANRSASFTVTGLLPATTKYYSVHLIRDMNGMQYAYADGRYHAPKSASFAKASLSSVKLKPKKAKIVVKVPSTQAASGLTTMYVYKGSKKIKTLQSNGKTTLSFTYNSKKASSSKYKVVSVCKKKTSIKTTSSTQVPASNTYTQRTKLPSNLNDITPYATARFVPCSVNYYNGKVKVTGYLVNNRIFKLKKGKVKVTVKNGSTKIGSKTVTYKKIKSSSKKKVTITFKTKKYPDFKNVTTTISHKTYSCKW